MNARPDHRRVLDNLDFGWPAETVTWAQAEYDAEMRRRQPDDPGIPVHAVGDPAPRRESKRPAPSAPIRARHDDDTHVVIVYLLGAIAGLIVLTAAAWSWGL